MMSIMSFFKRKQRILTDEQIQNWHSQGYLILKNFISNDITDAINREIDGITKKRHNPNTKITIDVLHGEHIGKRFNYQDVPPAFDGPVKINDLYLESKAIQNANLNLKLIQAIAELYGEDPLACNSLNFIYGSQQKDHIDSWYMPSPKPNHLIASSICLEDVHPDAGPFFYYPTSHKMPPYIFSHGGIHAANDDMTDCREYIEKEKQGRNFKREVFVGKKGDVFLWDGQLLHGGSAINNLKLTRKSLVTHYWMKNDVEPQRVGAYGERRNYLIK